MMEAASVKGQADKENILYKSILKHFISCHTHRNYQPGDPSLQRPQAAVQALKEKRLEIPGKSGRKYSLSPVIRYDYHFADLIFFQK